MVRLSRLLSVFFIATVMFVMAMPVMAVKTDNPVGPCPGVVMVARDLGIDNPTVADVMVIGDNANVPREGTVADRCAILDEAVFHSRAASSSPPTTGASTRITDMIAIPTWITMNTGPVSGHGRVIIT